MLDEKFTDMMKKLLGADYDAFAASREQAAQRGICLNEERIDAKTFFSCFPYVCEKIPYSPGGYCIDAADDEKIGSHPLHFAGAFYSQEPSAQSPVCSVPMKSDFKVLDVCASPGGKSFQAARIVKDGVIVSNEINASRAAVLMGNTERQGFTNMIVTNTDSKTLASWYDSVFDLVICDAPCSGEGMFRKDPAAADMWSEDAVLMCAKRQREIVSNAAKTVKGGGYLLYSTCTFSKEENEDVVSDFLSENGDFSLVEPPQILKDCTVGGINMPYARRFYPHVARGEGQFFALMRRNSDAEPRINYTDGARPLSKEDERLIRTFFSDNFDEIPRGRLACIGKTASIVPDFPVPPYSVFAAGVKIGEIEKGRVVPHHQLFSSYGTLMKRKIDLAPCGAEAKKYIGGETVSSDIPDGWCAVLCGGCALGGGKAVGGVVKNHYPKGLRRKIGS